VSPDEKEAASGASGEIWLKGPNIFKGYLNNPEGTANAFSSDGYFKTGDIGYADEQGNFYITDRVKELIKYKGFQVAPAELEGLLSTHPKVNDVAVIGLYDEGQATEIPRAYVVPAQGVLRTRQTEGEIANWVAARVASHKRLRAGVRLVDEIPKNASGKILRRVLKQKATQEAVGGKAKL
jgi:4-coumarate--CoA ligase